MEVALLIVVGLAVVAILFLLVRSRRQPSAERAAPLPAPAEDSTRDANASAPADLVPRTTKFLCCRPPTSTPAP